jgi:hypothetical protein
MLTMLVVRAEFDGGDSSIVEGEAALEVLGDGEVAYRMCQSSVRTHA